MNRYDKIMNWYVNREFKAWEWHMFEFLLDDFENDFLEIYPMKLITDNKEYGKTAGEP